MESNSFPRIWKHRSGEFILGKRTLLMGIVNVTPDSFSDGGKFFETNKAVSKAIELEKEGADILDFGAESTRPGSESVAPEEQLRRLLPVLEALKDQVKCPISVDTSDTKVAEECLKVGASIINDVSGFRKDSQLAKVCKQFDAGAVLMHMAGTPKTMQKNTTYKNLLADINFYLQESVEIATSAGIKKHNILVDPGIGFGKTAEQNYTLLGNLSNFKNLAAGVLVGPSRKAFTGEFSKLPAEQRQLSTAAAVALCVLNGADVVRVHDVKEMIQVVNILDRYKEVIAEEHA